MKKSEYQELCNICDDILLSFDASKARISIPWLHILRPHPYLLKTYKSLFKKESLKKRFISNMITRLKNLLVWWRLFLISLFCYRKAWFCSNPSLGNTDILFISHLVNSDQIGELDDFYFGDLPRNLSKKGYRVAIVLINHTKKNPIKFISQWGGVDISRIILSDILSVSDELHTRRLLTIEAKKLFELSIMSKIGLRENILNRASLEAYSNGAYRSLRIYKQIKKLVLKLKPSMVITTYEGHSWERMAFAAAHEINPKLTCVGYQHSAIFQYQHSVKRCLGKPYDPDRVVTSGSVTSDVLAQSLDSVKTPVSILGSYRNLKSNYKNYERQQLTCLVLPEGILSECDELFTFSVKCAKKMPMINFIWRLHPLINVEKIKRYNSNFKQLPSNIKFSEDQFLEDIKKSKWAIYRGSTAIIQAVINGVQPLYIKLKNEEIGIDPLFNINNKWKHSITQVEEFVTIVESDETNSSKIEVCKKEIIDYCSQYNMLFDYSELPRILKE